MAPRHVEDTSFVIREKTNLNDARHNRCRPKACQVCHFCCRRQMLPQMQQGTIDAVPRHANGATLIIGKKYHLECHESQLLVPQGVPGTELLSLATNTSLSAARYSLLWTGCLSRMSLFLKVWSTVSNTKRCSQCGLEDY